MNRLLARAGFVCALANVCLSATMTFGDDFRLQLRTVESKPDGTARHQLSEPLVWNPQETAVIVCDVWDYHHSINAVRRLEEMLPRMNALLLAARQQGATIIHAPSDCMPAYETHAARVRAKNTPETRLPTHIASWCSRIPSEETPESFYPIDQSDGGEDDDPLEHTQWAEQLQALGRNPNMPWKSQSPAIAIDAEQDYISDRGDEVWNILQHRKIQHVMMLGVHTNMCVLGRPFGLRQLVAQKIDVALIRDLTDCMYNPQRWPYVDHFTGNDLVVSYVEQFICPTFTSDQILGGLPVQFKGDRRPTRNVISVRPTKASEWTVGRFDEHSLALRSLGDNQQARQQGWLRCSLRFSEGALAEPASLHVAGAVKGAWLNGKPLDARSSKNGASAFQIPSDKTFGNEDPNLLVLQFELAGSSGIALAPPVLQTSKATMDLNGKWEAKFGASDSANNIPLPAKFGMKPDVFYTFP
jgi:nicotinamidase-related amidase